MAFATDIGDQYADSANVITFDLRTGSGVYDDPLYTGCEISSPCPYPIVLALSSGGSPVWETQLPSTTGITETIVAHEPTGLVTLDTETVPSGNTSPSVGLANLQVVDNTAEWTRDGQPQSAALGG